MKRGFKAEAERIASETRAELNLTDSQRLDTLKFARHLAIPVFTISQVANMPGMNSFSQFFSVIDQDSFSAVTIFRGYKRLIVHNENHHPHRQASNLTHEMSHLLLEHEPTPIINSGGQRYWDPELEGEASWLGAALLIPREGALKMAKSGCVVTQIAGHYGVSESLCHWRMRQSGISQQLQRWKGRWGV